MSNTTPDFSRDPERVQLAKVIHEAHLSEMGKGGCAVGLYQSEYLAMADAAITHLGSGYRLPEANEANAERLARAMYGDLDQVGNRAMAIAAAGVWLSVLATAFAEPAEKHEPDNGECSFPGCDRRQSWCSHRQRTPAALRAA